MATPGTAARYLVLRFLSAHRLIGKEIFRGTIVRTAVLPSQVLRSAILSGAAGIIALHTHPSGDPSPSMEDLDFTRQLSKACKALNLVLHDHLILGSAQRSGRWRSPPRTATRSS